jgi:hypothetical protein
VGYVFGRKDTAKTGKKSIFVRFRESNKSQQPARTPEELEAYLALPSDRDW